MKKKIIDIFPLEVYYINHCKKVFDNPLPVGEGSKRLISTRKCEIYYYGVKCSEETTSLNINFTCGEPVKIKLESVGFIPNTKIIWKRISNTLTNSFKKAITQKS